MRVAALSLGASLACAAACTVFDGLEPATGGGGSAATSDGGEGGAFASCATQSPACVLPELEAARLCARLASCEGLAAGLALSTGLPLAELDTDGAQLGFNFSACVDWLTAPLEAAHAGFASVSSALNCVSATSDCTSAGACLPTTLMEPDDPRCDGVTGSVCAGQDLIECEGREITACDHPSFGIATECDGTLAPTCRVGPCSDPGTRCDVDGAGVEYAVECTEAGDELVMSCSSHGLECTEGVGCSDDSGAAPTCTTPFAQRCRGASVATCTTRSEPSVLEALIDCEAGGLVCVEEGLSARCARPDAACSPYDAGINVCEGSAIALCLGGERVVLDCADLGMACANGRADGTSGRCSWEL